MKNLIDIQDRINYIINSELSSLAWNHNKYTTPCKICAFSGIQTILNRYPIDMINYLIFNSRKGGFQNKIFHEFISKLQNMLPIQVEKRKKKYIISSIEDPILNIFSGKTTFIGTVNNNIISNETTEIYIGGRKSYYIKPYYIGKIISFEDLLGENLLSKIDYYSFDKIFTKELNDNLKIKITHLMVVPHYQMGAMLYINKARKIIYNKYNNL